MIMDNNQKFEYLARWLKGLISSNGGNVNLGIAEKADIDVMKWAIEQIEQGKHLKEEVKGLKERTEFDVYMNKRQDILIQEQHEEIKKLKDRINKVVEQCAVKWINDTLQGK